MASYPETVDDTVLYTLRKIYGDKDITVKMLDGSILDIWGPVFVNGNSITEIGALPIATKAEAEAGVDNTKVMTSLRVKEAVTYYGILNSGDTMLGILEFADVSRPSSPARARLSLDDQWFYIEGFNNGGADPNVFTGIDLTAPIVTLYGASSSKSTNLRIDNDNIIISSGDVTNQNIIDFARTLVTSYVPILLPADPSAPLHAATKQYVDNRAAATGAQYQYNWSTNTTVSNPGNGMIKANQSTPSSATILSCSLYSTLGTVAVGVARIAVGDKIGVYKDDLITNNIVYTVSALPTITDDSWVSIPVTFVSQGSAFSFSNNMKSSVAIEKVGEGGSGGGMTEAEGDARYVNLDGDEMTGMLTLEDIYQNESTFAVLRSTVVDDLNSLGPVMLDLAPTSANHATRKDYVDTKWPLSQTLNAQTGTSYTLVLTDAAKLVTLSNAAAIALTIPTNAAVAFPVGTRIDLAQLGAGQVTVGGTPTIRCTPTAKFRAQYSGATLVKIATDEWLLVGDLASS